MKRQAFSIGRRLSWQLMIQAALILGCLCAGIYWATSVQFENAQNRLLANKVNRLSDFAQDYLRAGDNRFLDLLSQNAQNRSRMQLELNHADGRVFYQDLPGEALQLSQHRREKTFELAWPDRSHPPLKGRYLLDVTEDVQMMNAIAMILVLATVLGAITVGFSTFLIVRRGLRPLHALAEQTNNITTRSLNARLYMQEPVEELQPMVDQFNRLMERVERAYLQLEAFNADVAHELRTPLAALIGQTEVLLSRSRSMLEIDETLQSNLEELQRLSEMVNDMLFLSKADRGAHARRGKPVSLAAIAMQVGEFHEAAIEECGVQLAIEGDVTTSVDEALFKRALSNLLDNATRFASKGSTVRICFDKTADNYVIVTVENSGTTIVPENLSRLFDRFFRIDMARHGSRFNHGLGLAIVAAIARMHSGWTKAESDNGLTRISFAIAEPA
jgi:two-component system heavy metal sensor histidine kinase CusS